MNPAYYFKSKLMSKEGDGTYVSKPGKNACMASNHKSLHECFSHHQEESLMYSNKMVDEERIMEWMITKNHGFDFGTTIK